MPWGAPTALSSPCRWLVASPRMGNVLSRGGAVKTLVVAAVVWLFVRQPRRSLRAARYVAGAALVYLAFKLVQVYKDRNYGKAAPPKAMSDELLALLKSSSADSAAHDQGSPEPTLDVASARCRVRTPGQLCATSATLSQAGKHTLILHGRQSRPEPTLAKVVRRSKAKTDGTPVEMRSRMNECLDLSIRRLDGLNFAT